MQQDWTPRIYVGAGGTGRRLVALVKKLVQERVPAEEQGCYQFLAIDTDEYQEADCHPLDPHSEYLHTAGFRPEVAREADFLRDAVADWWFDSYTPPYIQQGAGAIRPVGRLCFFYHHTGIRNLFEQAVQRAARFQKQRPVGGSAIIYIIGSLAGGTGSAMLLDLALMARKADLARQVYVSGVIFMPDVFTVTQVKTQDRFKHRWMANGYAALKELVYFNERPAEFAPLYRGSGRERPTGHFKLFDQCLFFEPVLSGSDVVDKQQDMFELAGESLFLYSAAVAGARSGSLLVNTEGIHYAALGLQTIEYPYTRILEYARCHEAGRLLAELAPAQAPPAVEAEARARLQGDLEARGWNSLAGVARRPLQDGAVVPPERQPVSGERSRLEASVGDVLALYQEDLGRIRRELDRHAQAAAAEMRRWLDDQVRHQMRAEGRGLPWVQAYLRMLERHLDDEIRRLEGTVRERTGADAGRQARWLELARSGARRGLNPFGRRAADIGAQLEAELAGHYTQDAIDLAAAEAGLALARALKTQWLAGRLQRLDLLQDWVAGQQGAAHLSGQADAVRREMDRSSHHARHTQYAVTAAEVDALVDGAAVDRLKLQAGVSAHLWEWVTGDAGAGALGGLIETVQAEVEQAFRAALDLTLMQCYERIGRTPPEVADVFRQAALACKPFWSYVHEMSAEKMTRVQVVAVPADNGAWADALDELRIDVSDVAGDDPHRIIFLVVEGARRLSDVHLRALPEWFHRYQYVDNLYDRGEEERPLHAHRLWRALPEVDPRLPASPARLFGPAFVRGLIVRGEGDVYSLRLPDRTLALGAGLDEAMAALGALQPEDAARVWQWMSEAEEAERGSPPEHVEAPFRSYAGALREGRNELDPPTQALVRQAERYVDALRIARFGAGPAAMAPAAPAPLRAVKG